MLQKTAASTGTPISIKTFIDEQKVSACQIVVLCLCFLVVAVDGFDTAVVGFVAPAIRSDWKLSPAELTPVFAVALFGLMLGGALFGPLADRFGRKTIILWSIALFGVACLASAATSTVSELISLRFVAGLGLGGSFANAVTLVAEYCPERRKSSFVTLMVCGFPAGSVLAGMLTSVIESVIGWRGVLAIGGILPLVLVPFLFLLLPESVRYLLKRGDRVEEMMRTLARIAPSFPFENAVFSLGETSQKRSPVFELFSRAFIWGTLLLWLSFFINLMIGFLLISWLPTIVHDFGVSVQGASAISALFQGGGIVGGITLGFLMDKVRHGHYVVALAYVVDCLCLASIGNAGAVLTLGIAIFAAGFCNTGCQISLNALAAQFYPTANRATGVSWVNAVGRIGAIIGSSAGGLFLTWGWSRPTIFSIIAVPALIAAAAVFTLGRIVANRNEIGIVALGATEKLSSV